jgi:acetyl esterase
MASTGNRPYSRILFYILKFIWAAGERILRAILLNRFAPRTGEVERGIRYVFGGHRLQSLDVFRPAGEGPFPVLVYIHGGGYHFGDKRTYDRVCRSFAAAGYLVCNANYRMAPRWGWPEQAQDVAEAVAWAHQHASWFGGDPQRMFLGGDSAGAYFAALYAELALDEGLREAVPVRGCVPASCLRGLLLFYGAYDFDTVQRTRFPLVKSMATGFLGRDQGEFDRRAETASPQRHLAPGFPPCLIVTSEIDPLHPESIAFRAALEERGAACDYLNLPRKEHPLTYHGFLNFWWTRGARMAMRAAVGFMDKHR